MMSNYNLTDLIAKWGEQTFFDGELVGAYFTVSHLESLVNAVRLADAKDNLEKLNQHLDAQNFRTTGEQ